MNRDHLLKLLQAHCPFDENEASMHRAMCTFVQSDPDCFARTNYAGHITGSAWVVDTARNHVLLLHHAKLDRWLQPGGHIESDADVLSSALREAREESGLSSLQAVSTAIFDVDIHWIPARDSEPRHPHYDIRFLLHARRDEKPTHNSESKAATWLPLEDVTGLTREPSILRMIDKMANPVR